MKKNKFVVVLALVLVLAIIGGCSSNTTTAEKPAGTESAAGSTKPQAAPNITADNYKDGTYEGTSDAGKHPGLKVAVVVQGGKITAVNVIEHKETDGIGTAAVEELPASMVKAQSTKVDAVSGATLSSTAIKEAVDKALTQAKK